MTPPGPIRFGVFHFDAVTRQLTREGVPVRLQPQPAHVLAVLAGRAGEVVTREELRAAVWGSETYVDFERGLNFCVAQVRSALGDSADSPRYIKTLPRQGYQFIAPVQTVAEAPALHAPVPLARRISWRWLVIPAAALLLIGAAWAVWPRQHFNIAVTRFDNETGNPDLDRLASGLSDDVVAELTSAQDGAYGVIGNAAILQQKRERRDLVAIGSSLGSRYVVLGQVRRSETGIRVLAHLIRLPEQTHVWVTRTDLREGDLQKAEPEIARRIGVEFSQHLLTDRRKLL